MRKPRDFDSELKALSDKARLLRTRKVHQLGELVIATGADALSAEQLAGVLLQAIKVKDAATKEDWRKHGAAFFQRTARNPSNANADDTGGTATNDSDAPSAGT